MTTLSHPAYLRHRNEIAKLLDPIFYPLEYVDMRVFEGSIALLWNDTAAIGFEIRTYPGGARELHGMFAAGEKDGLLPLVDEAVEEARAMGCTHVTVSSRPAWVKMLKGRGFEHHQSTTIKELR